MIRGIDGQYKSYEKDDPDSHISNHAKRTVIPTVNDSFAFSEGPSGSNVPVISPHPLNRFTFSLQRAV
jgi:hypothetical protein